MYKVSDGGTCFFGGGGNIEILCDDGADNDGDTLTDCADPNCDGIMCGAGSVCNLETTSCVSAVSGDGSGICGAYKVRYNWTVLRNSGANVTSTIDCTEFGTCLQIENIAWAKMNFTHISPDQTPIAPNTRYAVSAFANTEDLIPGSPSIINLRIIEYDSNNNIIINELSQDYRDVFWMDAGKGWTEHSMEFTTRPTTTYIQFFAQNWNDAVTGVSFLGDIFVTEFQNCRDSCQSWEVAIENSPEFDFTAGDGSDACCGDDDYFKVIDVDDWTIATQASVPTSTTLSASNSELHINYVYNGGWQEAQSGVIGEISPNQNYLISGTLTVPSDFVGKLRVYVQWKMEDGTNTEMNVLLYVDSNTMTDPVYPFREIILSPSSAAKAQLIVIIYDETTSSLITLANATIIQTQDYGYVSDNHEWMCDYDGTNWMWTDATKQENFFIINEIGSIETVSSGNNWSYCDAAGLNILGLRSVSAGEGGADPIDKYRTPAQGDFGFGQWSLCESPEEPYYCGPATNPPPPFVPNPGPDPICVPTVYHCDVDFDQDGCAPWEEVGYCNTDPWVPDVTPETCHTTYTCTNGQAPGPGGFGGGGSDPLKDYCKKFPMAPICLGGSVYLTENKSVNGCTDEIDNDGDLHVDCQDRDCCGDPRYYIPGDETLECYQACTGTEWHCNNQIDDDGDGDVDCDDADCLNSFAGCVYIPPISLDLAGKSDSLICYPQGSDSRLKECCATGSCSNEQAIQTNFIDAFNTLAGPGVQLNTIFTNDRYFPDTDTYVDRISVDNSGDYHIVSMLDSRSRDWTSPLYTSLEFDIGFSEPSNPALLDEINLYIEYEDGTILPPIYIKNYSTTGMQPWRYHHVSIPFTQLQRKMVYRVRVYRDSAIVTGIDNFYLKVADQDMGGNDVETYYCTGEFSKWIPSLNPPLNLPPDEKQKYRYACRSQLSFSWTGNLCCGAETTKTTKEYYADTWHGCYGGYTVKKDFRVNDTLNIPDEHPDLLFYDGEFYSCDKTITVDNNYIPIGSSIFDHGIDANGKDYKGFISIQQNTCSVTGSWFCSKDGIWRSGVPTIDRYDQPVPNEYDYNTFRVIDHKANPGTMLVGNHDGNRVPPGVNMVQNGRFNLDGEGWIPWQSEITIGDETVCGPGYGNCLSSTPPNVKKKVIFQNKIFLSTQRQDAYQLSFVGQVTDPDFIKVGVYDTNENPLGTILSTDSESCTTDAGYTNCVKTIFFSEDQVKLVVNLYNVTGTNVITVDNISLINVPEDTNIPTRNYDSFVPTQCCPIGSCWTGAECINASSVFGDPTNSYVFAISNNDNELQRPMDPTTGGREPDSDDFDKGYRCNYDKNTGQTSWLPMDLKWNWDLSEGGYCQEETECYYRDYISSTIWDCADILQADCYVNNYEDILTYGQSCLSDGDYIDDHYCYQGEWRSRTGQLADILVRWAEEEGHAAYRVHCDDPEYAVNDQNVDNPPLRYCVLTWEEGGQEKTAIGTAIDPITGGIGPTILDQDKLERAVYQNLKLKDVPLDLSDPQGGFMQATHIQCPLAWSDYDNQNPNAEFEECSIVFGNPSYLDSNNLWVDGKNLYAVFSYDGIDLGGRSWLDFLIEPFNAIIDFIRNRFNPPDIEDVSAHPLVYKEKSNAKNISAFINIDYTSGTAPYKAEMVVQWTGYDANTQAAIFNKMANDFLFVPPGINILYARGTGFNTIVMANLLYDPQSTFGEFNTFNPYWLGLGVKTRTPSDYDPKELCPDKSINFHAGTDDFVCSCESGWYNPASEAPGNNRGLTFLEHIDVDGCQVENRPLIEITSPANPFCTNSITQVVDFYPNRKGRAYFHIDDFEVDSMGITSPNTYNYTFDLSNYGTYELKVRFIPTGGPPPEDWDTLTLTSQSEECNMAT